MLPPSKVVAVIGADGGPAPTALKARTVTSYCACVRSAASSACAAPQPAAVSAALLLSAAAGECHVTT